MCCSARVRQSLNVLIRKFGATVDWEGFELLFRRRLEDGTIKIARALEDNFIEPANPIAEQTKAHIDAFRRSQVTTWEQDVFKQKKRLADATRSLQSKETKKAREDVRIATGKLENCLERLSDLKRTDSRSNNSRIFPMVYAPVIVDVEGRRMIRPMRYTCRLAGKPAFYDKKFPGTYNAFGAFLTVSS